MVSRLLGAFDEVSSHRGSRTSSLGAALASALRLVAVVGGSDAVDSGAGLQAATLRSGRLAPMDVDLDGVAEGEASFAASADVAVAGRARPPSADVGASVGVVVDVGVVDAGVDGCASGRDALGKA